MYTLWYSGNPAFPSLSPLVSTATPRRPTEGPFLVILAHEVLTDAGADLRIGASLATTEETAAVM
jgi:hypothetical protein